MHDAAVRALFDRILNAWNRRDAASFAGQFVSDGHIVGFDGSQADSAAEIEAHLGQVFEGHQTAAYVWKIREVRLIGADGALLRAVVGMVPPGGEDLKPEVNSIQTLVAERRESEWQAVMLQTTPAAFHGRPEAVEALTTELRGVLHR